MRTEAPAVLMTLLGTDDDLRWKIVKVLKYLTRGGAPSIRYAPCSHRSCVLIVRTGVWCRSRWCRCCVRFCRASSPTTGC